MPHIADARVQLNAHPLTLHLSPGWAGHQGELLVYATGDGGWRGKDRDVYRQLQSWGYPIVGFSSSDYIKHLPGDAGTTTPARLASDFAAIIDAARRLLEVPESRPVILVGVSRGADLAVVAAGQSRLQPELAGVVAMGLTREEEYVHRRRRPDLALELYPYLRNLRNVPLSVIQSTRDHYLPAAAARELFGTDTPIRQFHAVEARNHSFAGARQTLYATLRSSLAWLNRLDRRPMQ
jgi:fermentation-respiration switch protein FrsA (DUF1100 family)